MRNRQTKRPLKQCECRMPGVSMHEKIVRWDDTWLSATYRDEVYAAANARALHASNYGHRTVGDRTDCMLHLAYKLKATIRIPSRIFSVRNHVACSFIQIEPRAEVFPQAPEHDAAAVLFGANELQHAGKLGPKRQSHGVAFTFPSHLNLPNPVVDGTTGTCIVACATV